MATWTGVNSGEGLSDTALEPNAPWTSTKALAVRDNPIAIAEGASGAPKVENAAFADDSIGAEKFQEGTTERDWVLQRTSEASVGVVGTYALLFLETGAPVSFGETRAGSTLRYSSASQGGATAPSGTWRAMGESASDTSSDPNRVTLWLRIS